MEINTYTANSVNEYTSWSGGILPPSYDANGNTLTLPRPDGTARALTWEINDRLTQATNTTTGDTATYAYDALGRRVKSSTTISSVSSTTYYLLDRWNVNLEYEGSTGVTPVLKTRLTWGFDLVGLGGSHGRDFQAAGGVGGLLMTEDLTSTPVASYPAYDGNGNITAWINASGTVTARQRYDAYGNIIAQTGTPASTYGFSTKPADPVTGLLYYGYRYYDPFTGRWPSRDPVGENGGINLYGYIENNVANIVDYLGYEGFKIPDYINPNITVKGFKKRIEESAYRISSETNALWNEANKCCSVQNRAKIDDGYVGVTTDVWYYSPPKGFAEALLENVIKTVVIEGAKEANLYAKLIISTSEALREAVKESSLPTPSDFNGDSLILGETNKRFTDYSVISEGNWKETSLGTLPGLTKSSCEALNKSSPITYKVHP